MKRIILLIGLLILIIYPIFSQQRNFPEINHWSYSKQIDTTLLNRFSGISIDSRLSAKHSENVYHLHGIYESPERFTAEDNIPIIKPGGNYPSLMIKPDTSMSYTLRIIKP